MKQTQLAPGVYLHCTPMEKFKTNQLAVSFIMPLDEKTASYATLLSMVLKTGCAKYPDVISIGKALDALYGASMNVMLRKKGDNHLMTFLLEFLDPAFSPDRDIVIHALSLLDDILFNPLVIGEAFTVEAVEREKKNLCDLIDSRINDKRMYALRRCGELTAQGQPYEAYECGSNSIVEHINAKDLYSFYKNYINQANVEFCSFGSIEPDQIISVFRSRFSKSRTPHTLFTSKIPSGEIRHFEENYPVEQAKLSMGFCFDDTVDPIIQKLFVILYGGSASSLLFLNVREKLSLCYYCSAMLEAHKNMLIVYSGVMPEKLEPTQTEILSQLENVQQGNFTDEDLRAAKKAYVNNLRSMADSMTQLEDYTISQMLLGCEADLEVVYAQIEQITKEAICAVAKTVKPVSIYVLKGEEVHE